jgi:hypothetical protein
MESLLGSGYVVTRPSGVRSARFDVPRTQRVHLAAGDREVADRSTGRPLAEVSAVRRVPNGAPQAAQLERRPVTELVLTMELPTIRPSAFLLVKSTQTSWLPRDRSGESEVR